MSPSADRGHCCCIFTDIYCGDTYMIKEKIALAAVAALKEEYPDARC
jgi:hypothetical protein